MRSISLFSIATLCVTLAPLKARGEAKECVAAYEGAQESRQEKKLIKAKEQLRRCMRSDCSQAIQNDCKGWYSEVEREMPTLVVAVSGADGRDAAGARVWLDGAPLSSLGSAVEVDPGAHKIRAEHGGRSVDEQVSLIVGEKSKLVRVSLKAPAPAAASAPAGDEPPKKSKGAPASAWASLGVAGLGLVAGAYFYRSASDGERSLVDRGCAPRCDPADVDVVRRDRALTYAGLGLGAVGLGAAAFFYFTRPSADAGSALVPRVDVAVSPRGGLGLATWRLF